MSNSNTELNRGDNVTPFRLYGKPEITLIEWQRLLNILVENLGLSKLGSTCFNDMLGVMISQRIESPSSNIVQNSSEGTVTFKTTATINDYVLINSQIPHSWKLGSLIFPHLHWFQSSATMPNLLIQYRWQKQGSAKTTSWTSQKYTDNAFTYTSGTLNQITKFGSITPPNGYSLSDIVQFRIVRDTANASGLFSGVDGLASSIETLMFDSHVEWDSMGSPIEYKK